MKHSVFKFIILTTLSTISSHQQPTTTSFITEPYTITTPGNATSAITAATTAATTEVAAEATTERITAKNSLIQVKALPPRKRKNKKKQYNSYRKKCKCKCKKKSVAVCTSKKSICRKQVCVEKCKIRSKKCHKVIGIPQFPKIKISNRLPPTEIKCGVKNDAEGFKLKTGKNNIFDPITYPGSKIAFGKTAERGEWPWQVSLREKPKKNSDDQFSRHFCGAVLIDSETVLTAAHCVWNCGDTESKCQKGEGNFIHDKFIVALGFYKTSVTKEEKQRILERDRKFGTQSQHIDTRKGRKKGKVIVHPNYRGESYYSRFEHLT